MINFKEWMNTVGTENVESKIDQLYNKANLAIKLVQIYSKENRLNLLKNISTIAPLNSGVYGLYNSRENKKVIGLSAANKIKFKFGNSLVQQNNINQLPNKVIKQYIPDIDENQLMPSDVIHVNVQRIVRELGDSKQAIVEIASTIVHEATHNIEFHSSIKINPALAETGPKKAEELFKNWVDKNWTQIISKIPQLKNVA